MAYTYRSASRLTAVAITLAVLTAAVATVAALATAMQLGTLETLSRGGAFTLEQAEAYDWRQRWLGIVELVVGIPEIVVFLMWVYRANCNARVFGAALQYGPGWSVGWFFVPILGLFMPYRVVRDLWRAGSSRPPIALPLAWWLCSVLVIVNHYTRQHILLGRHES